MALTRFLLMLLFIRTGHSGRSVVRSCDREVFDRNVDVCLSDFNRTMETSGYRDGCQWPTVKGSYNRLKICVDDWAGVTACKGRGFLLDAVFLEVHQKYFRSCGRIADPPLTIVIMLIAPVVIAAFVLPVLCVHLNT
ncbi:receptor activity-modifying protein 1-like [Aulostomus maculatus]